MSETHTRDAQGKLTKLVVDHTVDPAPSAPALTIPVDAVRRTVNSYTYYPNGAVNTIHIKKFDAAGAVLFDKTLKHFLDGRQPRFITPRIKAL